MVEKRTCDYTGEEIEPGTGIMYVQTDGTILHFVDSKAEKNYLLGREPRDLEWTEQGRANKGPVQDEPATEESADADEPASTESDTESTDASDSDEDDADAEATESDDEDDVDAESDDDADESVEADA